MWNVPKCTDYVCGALNNRTAERKDHEWSKRHHTGEQIMKSILCPSKTKAWYCMSWCVFMFLCFARRLKCWKTAPLTSCSSMCVGHAGHGYCVCRPARPGSQTCIWWPVAGHCLDGPCWRWFQTGRPQTSVTYPTEEAEEMENWLQGALNQVSVHSKLKNSD